MPLYDHECKCGAIFEAFAGMDDKSHPCVKCGKMAKRIITANGPNCFNDDSPWVRSVAEVVDKKSSNPHTQEFIKNPTRSNLEKHLKSSGLRHVDHGERLGEPPPPLDLDRHARRLAKMRQRKHALTVRGT